MTKKLILFVVLTMALMFAPIARADRGGVPHHKSAPTAPVLSFSCDGTTCVYAISPGPLVPLTAYDTSIQFVGAAGGCNIGTGGWHTDSAGAFVQVLAEDEIKCGGSGPGIVTAWTRQAGTPFSDPAIAGTSLAVLIN